MRRKATSETPATSPLGPRLVAAGATMPGEPPIHKIFTVFLLVGATSFGGGVVAYLCHSLVARHKWVDDKTFVELLSISETLPGLNATNMAVLVGDRLCGAAGAISAICGICLPGAAVMYAVAIAYHAHGDRPLATAALKGVAAAAVGLLTIIGVNLLHQSVPRVLLTVGTLAILWYRPRHRKKEVAGR